MGLFANSKSVKEATRITLPEDETILFETGANHFKGSEAAGGKLYFTNKRLVFKSHKFNFQNHEFSVSSDDILHAERYKTLGIVNNGLSVTLRENKIEKFVVQQPAEWLARLAQESDLQLV